MKRLQPFFDLPARPTKIDQKWKFLTSVFIVWIEWNSVWGLIIGQKQHRISLINGRRFFDLPAQPTKIDQKWKFLTSVFFVRFVWNLVWGLIMGQKQHRMSFICLRPFFDLPARPTKIEFSFPIMSDNNGLKIYSFLGGTLGSLRGFPKTASGLVKKWS